MPGGCTAYMMQQILDKNNNFNFLDAKPITISATEHRTAYGSDGDYYCKPNADELFKILYTIMHHAQPEYYSLFFLIFLYNE